jgi:hypothetical protein
MHAYANIVKKYAHRFLDTARLKFVIDNQYINAVLPILIGAIHITSL